MKIGIILDNPKREIDGILLIIYHLIRQGHEAYIIPMYQQGHDVPLLNLDGIVVNYARLSNRLFLRIAKELGLTVFVLDNEGSVIADMDVKTPTSPSMMRDAGVHAHIDHYLFWGRNQRDAFARAGLLPEDRLHVTGCPRYDVCSLHWRQLLDYPRRDYVLVNTNFCAINPLFTKTAQGERAAFLSVGWDSSYVEWLLGELQRVLAGYLDALTRLARTHRDRLFVIRPHPFEDPAIYVRTYADVDNVVVDGSGSVFNVIHNSACVLHLNCQTAVETLLLDKLPVSMEFLNSEPLRQHYPLPSQISHCAQSLDEIDDIIRNPEAYRSHYPAGRIYEQYIEPSFHINDGNAAARVADVVMTYTCSSRRIGWIRRHGLSIDGCLERPRLLQRAQGLLMNLVGSRAVSEWRGRLNPVRQTKDVGADFVTSMLNKIARHDGAATGFKVSHARSVGLGLPLATLRVTAA